MNGVLGQGKEQVHDREGEEHTGVDEDPPHRSLGQAGFGDRVARPTTPLPATIMAFGESENVGETESSPLIRNNCNPGRDWLRYLERLSILRNPGCPGEAAPAVRTRLDRRDDRRAPSAGDCSMLVEVADQPEYFPRIEDVHDSFGHLVAGFGSGKGKFGNTGLTLRPGDVVEFDGSAWDPEGIPFGWRTWLNRGGILYDGDGASLRAV